MTLCCARERKDNVLLEINSFNWSQRIFVFMQLLKRWSGVSSLILQKEHKGESNFPNLKIILFRYKTLLKSLYWNTRSLESFVTIRGAYIYFSNQDLNFEKYFCSTFKKKVLNQLIQLEYYKFLCYPICSDNKFDDFLLSDGLQKPDFRYYLSLL